MLKLSMSSSRASTAAATPQTGPMLPLLGPCCRLQATTSGRRAPVSGPSSRAHIISICKQCHLNHVLYLQIGFNIIIPMFCCLYLWVSLLVFVRHNHRYIIYFICPQNRPWSVCPGDGCCWLVVLSAATTKLSSSLVSCPRIWDDITMNTGTGDPSPGGQWREPAAWWHLYTQWLHRH